jgi:hypothetical protein
MPTALPSPRRSSASFRPAARHGRRDDTLGDGRIELRDVRGPRLVAQKPVHAFGGETAAPDASLGLACLAQGRVRPDPFGGEQYDLRPPNVLPRRVAVFDQSAEPIHVGRRDGKEMPVRIPQTRAPRVRRESPSGFKCQT